MKRIRKALTWLLCAVMLAGVVACTGEKGASGKKSPDIEMLQQKPVVTDCQNREKACSSPECATERVVVENNFFLLHLLTTPPPVAGQTGAQTEANAALAQKLDAVVKEFGKGVVEQCLSGGDCPVAAYIMLQTITAMMNDNADSKPNLGGGLSEDGKKELGGSGSGTPGGWGPEDEENARNKENVEAAKKDVERLGYDSNKVSHIFADKHQMDSLIKEFGSPEAALKEMHKAAQSVAKEPGAYQTGSWVTVRVGNSNVSVKGVVINGKFRISTATMRPF
ncbi:hypothetical protein GJV11_19195 [Enterobacteriaceae bacterium RIT693]|nr:hypothetical protein [Enterobacteriaceae bacterium RIT693]